MSKTEVNKDKVSQILTHKIQAILGFQQFELTRLNVTIEILNDEIKSLRDKLVKKVKVKGKKDQ